MPTCTHCKKTLNEATVHSQHCRAKKRPPRRKSCMNCYNAKVRCEPSVPSCTRCEAKNLECRFPEGSEPRTLQTRRELISPESYISTGDGFDRLESIGGNMDFSTMLGDILDVGIDVHTTLPWDDTDPTAPASSNVQIASTLESQHATDHDTSDILAGQFAPPWTLGHFLHSRYFPQVSGARPTVVSLTERLLIIALRSYPNMMQPDGGPPFIHHTHPKHVDMKTTLENCVSLALLWKSQKGFNGRFVPESVKREKERLLSEYRSLSLHGMLAASQAFTIYALLEYLDPNSVDLGTGTNSIPAIHKIAYYACRPGIICKSELIGRRPSWEDWILVESRRRTITILFLLDSLCELQQGRNVVVCPELVEMRLPSSKKLWEAPNRETWEVEYEKILESQGGPGRDLLKMRDIWSGTDLERLERWIAEMDVLGSVVMSIAMSANEAGKL